MTLYWLTDQTCLRPFLCANPHRTGLTQIRACVKSRATQTKHIMQENMLDKANKDCADWFGCAQQKAVLLKFTVIERGRKLLRYTLGFSHFINISGNYFVLPLGEHRIMYANLYSIYIYEDIHVYTWNRYGYICGQICIIMQITIHFQIYNNTFRR